MGKYKDMDIEIKEIRRLLFKAELRLSVNKGGDGYCQVTAEELGKEITLLKLREAKLVDSATAPDETPSPFGRHYNG